MVVLPPRLRLSPGDPLPTGKTGCVAVLALVLLADGCTRCVLRCPPVVLGVCSWASTVGALARCGASGVSVGGSGAVRAVRGPPGGRGAARTDVPDRSDARSAAALDSLLGLTQQRWCMGLSVASDRLPSRRNLRAPAWNRWGVQGNGFALRCRGPTQRTSGGKPPQSGSPCPWWWSPCVVVVLIA